MSVIVCWYCATFSFYYSHWLPFHLLWQLLRDEWLLRDLVQFFYLLLHIWRLFFIWEIIIQIILTLMSRELCHWKTFSFKYCSCLLIYVLIDVTFWVLFFNSGEILLSVTPNLSPRSRTYVCFNLLPVLFEQTNCFNKLFMFISGPSPCNFWVFLSESLLIWIYLRIRELFSKVELLPSCSSFIELVVDALWELNLFWIFLSFFILTLITLVSFLIVLFLF